MEKKRVVILIQKGKGEHQDNNSYRALILFSVPGMVPAHLLLMWIYIHLLIQKKAKQSGFTLIKSTTDRILALDVLVEHRCEF